MKVQWESRWNRGWCDVCGAIISFCVPEFRTEALNANPRLYKFQRFGEVRKRLLSSSIIYIINKVFFSSKFISMFITCYTFPYLVFLIYIFFCLFRNCKVFSFWHFRVFLFSSRILNSLMIVDKTSSAFSCNRGKIKSKLNRKQCFQGKKINVCVW